MKTYRPRLDHVLASVYIFPSNSSVNYLTQPRKLFDHKIVQISFRKHKFSPPNLVNANLNGFSIKQIATCEAFNTLSDYCTDIIDQNLHFKQYLQSKSHQASPILKRFWVQPPVALNKKDEKVSLELMITLQELWDVVSKTKLTSTPGPGYGFYKVFFKFLAYLILNCFYEMSINGELQSPFNLAKIFLIPKKDIFSNILNWRPISLCETSYKR